MSPPRVVVAGAGGRGVGCMSTIAASANHGVIVAYADPHGPSREKAAAVSPEARVFEDWREMLAEVECDVLLVTAPQYVHCEIVLAGLEAGLDIYCEKPMAHSLEDCNRIVSAVKASDCLFYVGLQLRTVPVLKHVKKLVDSGVVGKPSMMFARELRAPFLPKVDDWIGDENKSGGALVEKNCHHFDVFNWLIDSEPVSVFASGGTDSVYRDGGKDMSMWEHLRDPATHIDVVDNAIAIVDYANGARAGLTVCFFAPDHPLEIEVLCDHGRLSSDEDNYRLTTFHHVRDERQCHTFEPDVDRDTFDSFEKVYTVLEHREFVQCVQERRQPKADVHVGWWATMMCLAAERSIKEKRPICIRDMKRED